MKSSSEIYPVSLLKAESLGEISEDVYLIKHNLDVDKSVEVAVSHLTKQGLIPTKGSVVLVHGSFTNRGFWISKKGEGLAKYLLEQGFDVWLMEHRGHGNSPRNQDYQNNTVERYVLHDLRAVNEFVHEKSAQIPIWLGHSLGGVMITSAVAAGVFTPENCRAMVILGAQVIEKPASIRYPLMGSLMSWNAKRKGELDGRKLGIGPENEPSGLIVEFVNRHRLLGGWAFPSTRQRLLPAWQAGSSIPLLAIAAVADTTDSVEACSAFANLYGGPKELLLLGKEYGFSKDFGHVNMVVSKESAKEVWPKINHYLSTF